MMNSSYPIQFFFGANTPKGFAGFHTTDLYDPRGGWAAFLIKSGAGTGKATFMRRVYDALTARGLEGEAILCSSDPTSLDAVIFPDIRLCVVDATAPHIIEPTAYGECEQLVPFGCCLKPFPALDQATAWFEAADACQNGHMRCCRFLSAAAILLDNNRRWQETALKRDKLASAVGRLATREFGGGNGSRGRITRRFLSAVTPQGHVFFKETAAALCPKLYSLEDEHGAVASSLITQLCALAVDAGHDVILCPCPLSEDRWDHLLIPAIGVGFLSSNSHHTVDFPVFRRMHAARFLDAAALKEKKQQLSFNRRAADEMIAEAIAASADAKAHHDCMEALHGRVMDWETYRVLADETLQTIMALADKRMS